MTIFKSALFIFLCCCTLLGEEHVYLKTPHLSRDEIIGTNVGIRPSRKNGVRLEEEWMQQKLIIHNYGYGGFGMTLAFGGSEEVLQFLNRHSIQNQPIAVLGGGVIGLATAYDLLEKGYKVRMYADNWSPHVTSDVATGGWTTIFPAEQRERHQRMQENAEKRLSKSAGRDPEFAGVRLIPYYSTTQAAAVKPWIDVVIHFDNGMVRKGRRAYRLAIDTHLFMADLYAKVKSKGAILRDKHFDTVEEILQLEEPIIINCLSLGSRELFNDHNFAPNRGEVIYLKPQAGIDYELAHAIPHTNYFVYLIPWQDRLVLGGINEYGKEELSIDPSVIDRIVLNAQNYFCGH